MTKMYMVEAVRAALHEEMERDPSIILLGEDVGIQGGVFRASEGLQKAFGEARVMDTPLAESGIIGVAIGAAANGMHPVAEIQFADFIHSAMDQIISEAARIRYRSNGGWGCPLVIRAPYGGGVHGGLYHSQSVEAFFCHVPGLKVVVPSTAYDTKGLLKAAIRDPDPVMFFEHKKLYRAAREDIPDDDYVLPIGKATVVRQGTDVSVITYGLMARLALEAAEQLAGEGIQTEVVDLRTLVPLDLQAILDSVRKTSRALVVYEDNLTLGFGAEVAALIGDKAFDALDAPVMRLASPDIPAFPYHPALESACMPDAAKIADAIRRLRAY